MKQQTDLYHPYQTGLDLLDDELFANCSAMTITDASLPNRAGEAFVQLNDAICSAYEQSNGELLQVHWAVWRLVPQRHEPKPTPLKGSAASAISVPSQS